MYLILLALPLSCFICLSIFGRFLGARGSALLSVFSAISITLISCFIFYEVALSGCPCQIVMAPFFHSELFDANWGFLFDTLTAVMCVVVTLVSCLVIIFSCSYMIGDPHFIRFLSYLKLFTVAMLILVTADNYIQLFVGWEGVGLATRAIVGSAFTAGHFNTEDIIRANFRVLDDRSFLPPVCIWHTDRESLFRNALYETAMSERGVLVSRGSAKAFSNQPIESVNRTFKIILTDIIKKKELTNVDPKILAKINVFKECTIEPDKMQEYVLEAIGTYNNKIHSKHGNRSPNEMENAFYLENGNQHPQIKLSDLTKQSDSQIVALPDGNEFLPMLTTSGSAADDFMKVYTAKVKLGYTRNMLEFVAACMREFQREAAQRHQELIYKLDQRASDAELHESQANERYVSLLDTHIEIKKQLAFVHEQAQNKKREDELAQIAKLKRKGAKKRELRQTVSKAELQNVIFKCITGRNAFVKARRHVAILILFLTGLRVSNLILISVGQLTQLLEKGHVDISLIKGGSIRHPLRFGYAGHQIFKASASFVKVLTEGRAIEQSAFCTTEGPISEHTLERELNAILTKSSDLLNKHLRTHSFRASIITGLIAEGVPPHEVQQVVGHVYLASTLIYYRGQLTAREIDKRLNRRFRSVL